MSTPQIVLQPEAKGQERKATEIELKALQLADEARKLVVDNDEQYVQACETLKSVTRTRNSLDGEVYGPNRSAAYAAWKAICNNAKKVLDPLDSAISTLKEKIGSWDEKKENERLQLEQQTRERLTQQQEDLRLNTAAELERAGRRDEAEQVLNSPNLAPPVVVPKSVPLVRGVSFRDSYKVEVINFRELVRAVADGRVPLQALKVDESFLNSQARAYKGLLSWPGIRVFNLKGVATRTR